MVSQVGLNTGLTNYYTNTGLTNPMATSSSNIFGTTLQTSVNNYEDDFLMPDYLKSANITGTTIYPQTTAQTAAGTDTSAQAQQQLQQSQQSLQAQQQTSEQSALINQPQALVNPSQQTAFTGQNYAMPQQTQYNYSHGMENSLAAMDKNIGVTESGNFYKKSATFAKFGALAGAAVPVATRAYQVLKGASAKSVFKIKPLALTAGILGLAGYIIGKFGDNYVNTQRAQKADSQMYLAGQNRLALTA